LLAGVAEGSGGLGGLLDGAGGLQRVPIQNSVQGL